MRPSCTQPRLQSGPDGPEVPRMRLPAPSALASREIRRVNRPSSDNPFLRPLPAVLPLPSARRFHPVRSFHPRGFSPPRRLSPQEEPRACCIPMPEGVRRVSRLSPPLAARSSQGELARVRSTTAVPAAPFTPLEEVLPLAAASHHCDRCPLAVVPPRRRSEQARCAVHDDPRPRGVAPPVGP